MIRFLLSLFGLCPHVHDRRERSADGRLDLVCEACGRRVPALQRDASEIRAMRKKFKPVKARKAIKLQGEPASVTPIAAGRKR